MKSARCAVITMLLLALIGAASTTSFAAAKLTVSPGSFNFGSEVYGGTGVGQAGSPMTFDISNHAKVPISKLTLQIKGTNSADFTQTTSSTPCGNSLAAGANCTVALIFAPTGLSSRVATLMVADATNPRAGQALLSGIGARPQKLNLPSGVPFGSVTIGQTSDPQPVTVSNPNTIDVALQSISTSGPFAVSSSTCGATLPAGGQCEIDVVFKPTIECNTSGGLETGALNVANEAGMQVVPASGTAVAPSSTPPQMAILAGDISDVVLAYPLNANGDVAPIASLGIPFGTVFPYGVALDSGGNIYVANNNDDSVTIYAACANGNVTPVATIAGANTGLSFPTNIALDQSGNIYVTNSQLEEFVEGSVTIYPPLTSLANQANYPNVTPIGTITGANTGLTDPRGIAVDSNQNIYVTNPGPENFEGGHFSGPSAVTIYSATAVFNGGGNIAPKATIKGARTGLRAPIGIALDAAENIYVSNSTNPGSITIYAAGSTGNVRPSVTIAGAKTDLSEPQGIALDAAGKIYVTNGGGFAGMTFSPIGGDFKGLFLPMRTAITVYARGSKGNARPSTMIFGSQTDLDCPQGIGLDAKGNIYVADPCAAQADPEGEVLAFAVGSDGNTPPAAIIGGSRAEVDSPTGIAFDSNGNIYVANSRGGPGDIGTVTVYAAGTDGNFPPTTILSGTDTGMNSPSGIALDSEGNIYLSNSVGGTSNSGSVTRYAPGSSGDAMPDATITGTATQLNNPQDLALDSKGNIYVVNCGIFCTDWSVNIYPPNANGNEAPLGKIAGTKTGLNQPQSIALDSHDNIYVLNYGTGTITMYAAGSSGDAAPIATISDVLAFTNQHLALDSNGNIYVASVGGVAVYATGSTGNATPTAFIGGGNTGLTGAMGIAVGPITP